MSSVVIQDKELLVSRFRPISGAELEAAIREVKAQAYERQPSDGLRIAGVAHAVLRNGDGEIKHEALYSNLVTLVGNEYFGERAAGIASPPDQVSGMQLGTGTTAPSATGPGAAIVTHVADSNVAITGGYPQSSNPSGGIRRITWLASWAAGVATNTALAEATLINPNPLGTAAAAAANTIARILLSPTINKGSADTLDLTYQQDIGA